MKEKVNIKSYIKYSIGFVFLLLVSISANSQMHIRVRGHGIDINNVKSAGLVNIYPLPERTKVIGTPGKQHLFDIRPAAIVNKDFATTPIAKGYWKTDSRTDYSLDSFSADKPGIVVIAVNSDTLKTKGWRRLPEGFSSSVTNYYLYDYNYKKAGVWVSIPKTDAGHPTILFAGAGQLKFDNPLPLSALADGVLIAKNEGYMVVDPCLILLPNGDYIAECNVGELPISTDTAKQYVHHYISKDKGKTWSKLTASGVGLLHSSTFYFKDALYCLGDFDGGYGGIVKSIDGGKTWSKPVKLIREFRNSPSHVEVSKGRIWISYENLSRPHTINFLSASTSGNLMLADSWITTQRLDSTGTGNETDMVLGRDGWPIAMPKSGGPAVRALRPTEAIADKEKFTLPVSGSKYTAKYDPVSDRWWALTSYSPVPGNVRTGIALFSSADLKTFTLERQVLQGESNGFHGFNYPYVQIDGDDIIFVSRTSWEDENGLAPRWHDANMFTFHRVHNFRKHINTAPGKPSK